MSDRKNSEGYSDPTAYQAMMNLEIEELRFKKLLKSIKDVCVTWRTSRSKVVSF